jgi:transcriptional regulator with XRE-family HTH domain
MEDQPADNRMANWDLGTALVLLRVVTGWTQEELARASGVRGSSISDYERGKMVPGLNTLRRMVHAEGFPLATLEQALTFIEILRSERRATDATEAGVSSAPPFSRLFVDPATFRLEVEDVAAVAGNALVRMVRLLFTAVHQGAGIPVPEPDSAPTEGKVAPESRPGQ